MVALVFSTERTLEEGPTLPAGPFPLAGAWGCGAVGTEVEGESGGLEDDPGLL